MSGFRTFHRAQRLPAVALQPVVDPAGSGEDLRDVAAWSYKLSGSDVDELVAGVEAVRP